MNKLISLVGFVTVVVSLSTIAEAKAKKPVVCLAWTEMTMVVDGDKQPVAVCQDGKKPVILTTFIKTTILDEGGVKVPAVIGYR